mmetsp:Transcript_10895/g.21079  ORF Transcript_10895/g.21079 Transcript_10895/m.21079 type:complete len:115 (-) Transcript_10895:491-835(-)
MRLLLLALIALAACCNSRFSEMDKTVVPAVLSPLHCHHFAIHTASLFICRSVTQTSSQYNQIDLLCTHRYCLLALTVLSLHAEEKRDAHERRKDNFSNSTSSVCMTIWHKRLFN